MREFTNSNVRVHKLECASTQKRRCEYAQTNVRVRSNECDNSHKGKADSKYYETAPHIEEETDRPSSYSQSPEIP